ncbi:hypothetical protein [uncultured Desulfosarcina sp.]|uniref:hypothetical protein n=1 Tax=uncultured Desulfosarcina sp. TaxID=218289 RepID=UPI0029C6EE66|nr:hypothetical protein [uncultured Desulfosarcina sp.]
MDKCVHPCGHVQDCHLILRLQQDGKGGGIAELTIASECIPEVEAVSVALEF